MSVLSLSECVTVFFKNLQHCKITSDRCIEDTVPFYTTASSKSRIVTCLYVKQLGKDGETKDGGNKKREEKALQWIQGRKIKSNNKDKKLKKSRKKGMRTREMMHRDTEEEVAFELFCLKKYSPACCRWWVLKEWRS